MMFCKSMGGEMNDPTKLGPRWRKAIDEMPEEQPPTEPLTEEESEEIDRQLEEILGGEE